MSWLILLVLSFSVKYGVSSVVDYNDWSVDENALFPAVPIAAPWSEDEQCRKDSRLLMTHLKNKTYWAMQMWDASSKTETGQLYGNVFNLGNFDECMLVKKPFKTQFCGVSLRALVNVPDDGSDPYDLDPSFDSVVWKKFKDSNIDPSKYPRDNFTFGICVPASCSWKELNKSVNQHLEILNSKAGPNDPKYVGVVKEVYCTQQDPIEYSWSEICLWTTIAFLLAIQLFVFLFEKYHNTDSDSKAMRLLKTFSFRQNMKYLLKTETDDTQLNQLKILYSIKFLSVLFIVFDHRGAITFSSPISNFQKYEELTRTPENLFTLHGDLVVDSFFFISGLLTCYLLLELYKKKFVNPFLIIFGRWIRLAPLYYFMVWFHADGLLRLGSGATWSPGLTPEVNYCKKNWWANLLFLNNYVRVDESCMIHSWYIPCDFHLFIFGIFIVIAISKNEKFGIGFLGFLTFVSTLIPGIITYIYKLKPLILFYPEFFGDIRGGGTWQQLYIPTHARASVYFIGMIMGYVIYKTKNYRKKMSSLYSTGLLIVSGGLLFAPMAYGSLYYDPRRPYNLIQSSIFGSLRRFSWGLGCSVFMFVNCFGKNPYVTNLSRRTVYLILGKLTYSIYLVHFYMQYSDRVKIRSPGAFSMYDTIAVGSGDLLLSIIYGGVLYLLIELPFKAFIHELLFAKVVSKVKEEIRLKDKSMQMDVNESSNCIEPPNVVTVKL